MENTPLEITADRARAMMDGHAAGREWALSLRVGMKFDGAMPAARQYSDDAKVQHMFLHSALDVMPKGIVCNEFGIILQLGLTS